MDTHWQDQFDDLDAQIQRAVNLPESERNRPTTRINGVLRKLQHAMLNDSSLSANDRQDLQLALKDRTDRVLTELFGLDLSTLDTGN